MNYILIGGVALIGLVVGWQLFMKADVRKLARFLRYAIGGVAALATGFLLLRGQVGIATFTGYAAFAILRQGRLGPFVFTPETPSDDNESAVRSRFLSMSLDHSTGDVSGKVTAGRFRGRDLLSLGEAEMLALLGEVAVDPDSLALLETWLDRNREGWRETLGSPGAQPPPGGGPASAVDEDQLAYDILGLKPGATEDEIRAAHRNLMKGVHPDQGGSNFLAARINEAKDRLLRKVRG